MTTAIDDIAAGAAELPLPDGVWRVDPQHSEIGFAVKDMWGLRTVHGVFGAYGGVLTRGPNGAAGELAIEAASLDTGNSRRDRHLRSAAFFDVERHPRIAFVATAVAEREGCLTVAGDLTIGSSSLRLEIPATLARMRVGALRLEGKANVSRAEAGLAWNVLGMIRGDATVHVHLTLVDQGGADERP
jgi:polyisoprenoid-binding protein YceI